MSTDTIYWIFSTLPQVIAALTGLSLTAITFLFSNLNDEVQRDKTLKEIIDKVEGEIHIECRNIIFWSLLAIGADCIVLFNCEELSNYLNHLIDTYALKTFLLFIGLTAVVSCNVIPLISIYHLLSRILNPSFKGDVIQQMAREENNSQKEQRSADPMEFIEYFRAFESKIRKLYERVTEGVKESVRTLTKMLRNEDLITIREYNQLLQMITMRNVFIHGGDIDRVDYGLIDTLENVTDRIEYEISKKNSIEKLSPRDKVFSKWIDYNVDNLTEAYELVQAIQFNDQYGQYRATEDNGVIYVSSFNGKVLRLNSENACKTFISMLDKKFGKDGLSVEESYHFKRNLDKDD